MTPKAQQEPQERNMVREIREALKLNQEQMAEELGCGYSTVRYWEQNSLLPSAKAVLKNLERLGKRAGLDTAAIYPKKASK